MTLYETFQQSGLRDFFKQVLGRLVLMYENLGSQFTTKVVEINISFDLRTCLMFFSCLIENIPRCFENYWQCQQFFYLYD